MTSQAHSASASDKKFDLAPFDHWRRNGITIRGFLGELDRRGRLLYRFGWFHVALAVMLLALMPIDSREILGIDRWLKPFKFAVSIWIYLWTFAWLAAYLRSGVLRKALSWITAACMLVEIVAIVGQPLRGQMSHFNITTPLDGSIYGIMGTAIGISTGVAAVLLVALCIKAPAGLSRGYLAGVRVGLVVFLVGSGVGGAMVGQGSHAVGVPDGGPGLPLVNWSTEGGDLRVAHGLGLHAMQVLPLFAFWAGRRRGRLAKLGAPWSVVVFGVAYAGLTAALYLQAMAARPLL